MEKAQQRLTEESDILTALDNRQFAIWLQPQVNLQTGEVKAPKRCCVQQPDGSGSCRKG
jgi:EAL domain-containing protein (putative c-di-GMP-specific phosphodiesterase class I)